LTEGGQGCDLKRVKKSFVGWLAVLSVVSVLASPGCDSDDGTAAAALMSCNAFCDAYLTAKCTDYPTLDDCKAVECSDLPRQPAGCQSKVKSYYDCRQAQAAICINPDEPTEECFAEFDDLLTCSA
jgi:hypothetical protein